MEEAIGNGAGNTKPTSAGKHISQAQHHQNITVVTERRIDGLLRHHPGMPGGEAHSQPTDARQKR